MIYDIRLKIEMVETGPDIKMNFQLRVEKKAMILLLLPKNPPE